MVPGRKNYTWFKATKAGSYDRFEAEMLIPMTGVFFLACGASALNQYQDRQIDALMDRTKQRPIPLYALGHAQDYERAGRRIFFQNRF